MARRAQRKHNPMAKALASPLYRPRIVQAKKGRGAYTRRARTPKST